MLSPPPQISTRHAERATAPPRYDANASREFGALRSLHRKLNPQDPRVIREAASLLTSQLVFAPLLAEARKLPFGREVGHGGRMEEAFGEQLDQRIADTVARRDRGLTVQLAARLAARHGREPVQPPAAQHASWPVLLQARQESGGSRT